MDFIKQLKETSVSDLDFNSIGVWPQPFRIILLAIGFILILVFAYYFHISDLNLQHEKLVLEETRLKGVFEEKAFEAANLGAYRQQMVEIEESFGALLAQLPTDSEVPGMLEDITEIGYGSSLEIQSITLQPELAAEFYVELPIKIVALGGYHDFGSFVSGIAGLPRIVTLHDYSISVPEGSRLLQFEVMAKTYRYKGEGE
ncbi:MAG: type 4a pilus biogenesis protein PilO [Porticoccaceae bacterium]|nr:type 4a pilus biogenesis protein PilO [Porticoccaceae bacterium]